MSPWLALYCANSMGGLGVDELRSSRTRRGHVREDCWGINDVRGSARAHLEVPGSKYNMDK